VAFQNMQNESFQSHITFINHSIDQNIYRVR